MTRRRASALRWVLTLTPIFWGRALAGGAPPPDFTNQPSPEASVASERLIEALEKPLLESRQHLRAGRLELDSHYTTNKTQPIYEKFTTHYTVLFDGLKLRMDRERRFPDHRVSERRILNENQFIRADPAQPERRLPALEVNTASAGLASQSDLFQPYLVGLRAAPIGEIGHAGIFDPFERGDRANARVSDEAFGGRPAKQISFEAGSGHRTSVKIWMSPDHGNGVLGIRVESTVGSPPRRHVWETVNELRRWPPVNLWYPSRVTYRLTEGGSLVEEEDVTVDELIYDQAPAEKAFTLVGLQPEQGREVVVDGTQLMAWNDGKLAPITGALVPEPLDAASRSRQRFNWILVGNGVFLLAIAVFLIVRMRASRRPS
jgi:hypothetical protein